MTPEQKAELQANLRQITNDWLAERGITPRVAKRFVPDPNHKPMGYGIPQPLTRTCRCGHTVTVPGTHSFQHCEAETLMFQHKRQCGVVS